MKLKDALKIPNVSGHPIWIPDCNRRDLPYFFKEMGFKKGVEIGVSWADNIIDYCEAGLEIYGIDPWKDSEDNIYRKIISIPKEHAQTVDDVYKYAVKRTSKYPNCKLIRKLSMDVIKDFPNRSLDFVYIDGNHGFGYVAMDLAKWSQKVRKGGIIAGHDYYSHSPKRRRQNRHVGGIVNAFAKVYDFNNWYVLGSKERKEGEDMDLSYVFIKHW